MRQKLKIVIIKILYGIYKIIRAPILIYQKKYNITTKGVRVLFVYQNKIILVRHWYNNLWQLPGGGIKKHETPEQAAAREVTEETRLQNIQLDYLLGIYQNNKGGKDDIVYCYVIGADQLFDIKKRFNIEISDIAWFDIDNLPIGTSGATRQRIIEYQNKDINENLRPWS